MFGPYYAARDTELQALPTEERQFMYALEVLTEVLNRAKTLKPILHRCIEAETGSPDQHEYLNQLAFAGGRVSRRRRRGGGTGPARQSLRRHRLRRFGRCVPGSRRLGAGGGGQVIARTRKASPRKRRTERKPQTATPMASEAMLGTPWDRRQAWEKLRQCVAGLDATMVDGHGIRAAVIIVEHTEPDAAAHLPILALALRLLVKAAREIAEDIHWLEPSLIRPINLLHEHIASFGLTSMDGRWYVYPTWSGHVPTVEDRLVGMLFELHPKAPKESASVDQKEGA
jgi:hypothetical protein